MGKCNIQHCRSCNFLIKVKCVTTYHYKWSTGALLKCPRAYKSSSPDVWEHAHLVQTPAKITLWIFIYLFWGEFKCKKQHSHHSPDPYCSWYLPQQIFFYGYHSELACIQTLFGLALINLSDFIVYHFVNQLRVSGFLTPLQQQWQQKYIHEQLPEVRRTPFSDIS